MQQRSSDGRKRPIRSALLAAALGIAAPGELRAAPLRTSSPRTPAPSARPQDPDRAAFMRAPAGQPPTDDRKKDGPWASGASSRRRVAFAVSPIYAAYRMAFLGRTPRPIRGGGLGLDLDVLIYHPVSLRVSASYTGHRVQDAFTKSGDDPPKLSARGGTLHTVDFGGAVVFSMDLGRARPLLEAGIGGMFIRTPSAAQDGQLNGKCLDGGGCDVGLACATDVGICRQGIVPRLHAGAGIEVMLADRWSIGATIRYFALLTAPTIFPVYLQAGLRLGMRF